MEKWEKYWDASKPVYIEKSPPNLIRTRFLQEMIPNTYFITIIRHPIAVSYATQRWSKKSIEGLMQHWLEAYKVYEEDKKLIRRELFFSYEYMVQYPLEIIRTIEGFLDIKINYKHQFQNKNDKYFQKWEDRKFWKFLKINNQKQIIRTYEKEVNHFGYSLTNLKTFPKYKPQ